MACNKFVLHYLFYDVLISTQGGIYRCHSTENVQGYGVPTKREQRRKASKTSGYTSDSTLISSSLSKRVVKIRSSRGKTVGSDSTQHSRTVKSPLTTSRLTYSSSTGVSSEGAASHQNHHSGGSLRSKLFHFDSHSRAKNAQQRTSTIIEETTFLRSVSPPADELSAPPTNKYLQSSDRELSRGHSPAVNSFSLDLRTASRDHTIIGQDFTQRANGVAHLTSPTLTSPQCADDSTAETQQEWVVYGYV